MTTTSKTSYLAEITATFTSTASNQGQRDKTIRHQQYERAKDTIANSAALNYRRATSARPQAELAINILIG